MKPGGLRNGHERQDRRPAAIDGDPSRQDVDYDLAKRAVAAGCLLALDSDAHATGELRYAETAIAHARLDGVPKERVINCWPLDRLIDWARSRRTQP
jgi:putative hydrolase